MTVLTMHNISTCYETEDDYKIDYANSIYIYIYIYIF